MSATQPHLAQPDVNPSFTKAIFGGELREDLDRSLGVLLGPFRRASFRDRAMRDKAVPEIEKAIPDLEMRTQDDGSEFRIAGLLKGEAL